MEENIKTALTEFINITETEWLVFSESLIIKHYKKGEYFLREEDLCDYIGYIDKGLFSYYYLINGVEHIRGFFFSNDFISNYPCYLLNNKSKAYIKALEDSSLTLIHRDVISLQRDYISVY